MHDGSPDTAESGVIAIDVLLEPDAATLQRAREFNARLRGDHPDGFAFDGTRLPHVTLAQRYVRTDGLQAACEAVAVALAGRDPRAMRLRVTGLHVRTHEPVGSASWLIADAGELRHLSDACLAALAPFACVGGDASAFVPNEDGRPIRPSTLAYVECFVPQHSGARYVPHVTLGRARAGFLRELQREPFQPFDVSPAAFAIHQLGNHGTARRRLWRWPAG